VKQPGDRVQIISRRTIGRRRQQDDFRPHGGADRAGEFISHHDTFGHPSGQIVPFYHPGLQHGQPLFQIGHDAEELHASRLMGRADEAGGVDAGTRGLNPGVGGDGGNQSADVSPVPPAQGLVNGTVRIVIRSMHLNIGENKIGAALNHLLPQPGHEARNEQQHGVAQADRRHRDQRSPGIIPEIAPREPRQPSDHCFRFLGENVSSLIGASNAIFS
jgi:hypothetical protein